MKQIQTNFTKEETRNLEREFGSAFTFSGNGQFRGLNEQFFSELYRRHHRILFEPGENKFYQYEAESGLWRNLTNDGLIEEISEFSRSFIHMEHFFEALNKLDHTFCSKVMKLLKGKTEKSGAFRQKHEGYRIHCANCVLEFDFAAMDWVSRPFAPEDYSRNRTEIPYLEGAQAPRFLTELIQPAMNEQDAKILQLYMGQCLLGDNPSQRFLLITGTAGGGKSTLVNVIEQLVTRQNCTELRLEHMHGRFENSRLVGKTLLTGKDVKAGFLDSKGAPMLKALTGKDILTTEFKHSNSAIEIVGNYNVIITSNATLQVRLENDAAAWKRRMLWIKYENQPPAIPIENFDQLLIREEGSGILNFALDGARELLSQGGKIKLFPAQEKRIDALLEDTDPVRLFIRECLEPEAGANVSQKELWTHFNRYITLHELEPIKQSAFRKILPDLMEQELHVTCRHDIMQDGRAVRGYANVTFKS